MNKTLFWTSDAHIVSRDPCFNRLTTLKRPVVKVNFHNRNLRGIQEMASSRVLPDPGSRPVSRGLAGMTNCDTASKLMVYGIYESKGMPYPS
jgi:hypothetical protein